MSTYLARFSASKLDPKGRGERALNLKPTELAMTWDPNKYVKLLLQREADTQDKWLIALRTTADYYGWTEQFPAWRPKTVRTEGDKRFCYDPGRLGRLHEEGGRRHKVCRDPSRCGTPAGKTNRFKLSSNCGLVDIAEVAHFTKSEWYWMSAPNGERIRREAWERIYQGGISRTGGVLSRPSRARAA